jgi:uncharacterized phage protein (TIGR01671 family)
MQRVPKYKAFVKQSDVPDKQHYSGVYEVTAIDFLHKQVMVQRASIFAQSIFSFDDVELLQYTGINDKNNVEIYEDDIVTVNLRVITSRYIASIEDGHAQLTLINSIPKLSFFLSTDNRKLYEVIGNVCKNPMLNEGGDNAKNKS